MKTAEEILSYHDFDVHYYGSGKLEVLSAMEEYAFQFKQQPLHGEDVSKIRLAVSEAWEECSKWEMHDGTALTLAEYLDKNHPIK